MEFPEVSLRFAIIGVVAVVAAYLGVSLASLIQIWLADGARLRTTALDAGEMAPSSGFEEELHQLRGAVAGFKRYTSRLKTALCRVSPQFDQALVLAECGSDARDIAERCGISALEAELVLAVSDNQWESNPDEN